MFFYASFKNAKNAGLLIFLLTLSMVLQAESSDTSAMKAETTVDSSLIKQQAENRFPRWPEPRQVNRKVIPPPPPGPYISSALRGYSVKEPSFGRNFNRPDLKKSAVRPASSKQSKQTFSPDIPWPGDSRSNNFSSPRRWMPENGYGYAKPRSHKKPYPVTRYNAPSNFNYGYVPGPNMSRPNMSRSDPRRMPSMGITPMGPNSYAPNKGYAYRSRVNNFDRQPANPGYRAPYPSPGHHW